MQLDVDEVDPVLKRLRRAHGQLAAVIRMIEEEREVSEVVTQLAACGKALDRAGFAFVSAALTKCIRENGADRCTDLGDMEKLFLTLS